MPLEIDGSRIFTYGGQKVIFPRDGNQVHSSVLAGYDSVGVAHAVELSTTGRLLVDSTLGSGKAPTLATIDIEGDEYTILGVVVHTSSSGSGVVPVALTGKVIGIGFIAPSPSATYTVEVLDSDGFTVLGSFDLTGNTTVSATIRCSGAYAVNFSNATNGVYRVQVWYE